MILRRRHIVRSAVRRVSTWRWALLAIVALVLPWLDLLAQAGEPAFVENAGQWDSRARYLVDAGSLRLWFEDNGFVYDLHDRAGRGHVVRVTPVGGASVSPRASRADGALRTWISGSSTNPISARSWREITYDEIVPGIAARFHTVESGGVKYDLIVRPGADPNAIRFRYDGAEGVAVAADGGLLIETSVGTLREEAPVAWQEIDGARRSVPAEFTVDSSHVEFRLGAYDPSFPLIIDPLISFSTFLGGAKREGGKGVAIDTGGFVYVTGWTSSTNFPTTVGAYQRSLDSTGAAVDVFVVRLDPAGRRLLWGTYVGGEGADDPAAIRVDSSGRVIVGGTTSSRNFPTTSGGVAPLPLGSEDGFVFALKPGGGDLAWSTYVGGEASDSIAGIDLDVLGNVVVTGTTASSSVGGITGGIANQRSGPSDAFVLKLRSDGAAYLGGTLLGGAAAESSAGLVVGPGGETYVLGWTESVDFPTSTNAISATLRGARDLFVVRLSFLFDNLDFGTYLGGSLDDVPASIAIDPSDRIYLTGRTFSVDFPTTISAGIGSWIAARIDWQTGTLDYGRRIVDDPQGRGAIIRADELGRAYVGGTVSRPTSVIGDGIETLGRDGPDLALLRLSADGATIEQLSLIGGSDTEEMASDGVLAPYRDLYVTGTTRSENFWTSPAAFDSILNVEPGTAQPDAFVLRYAFEQRGLIVAPPRVFFDTLNCEQEKLDTFYVYNRGERPVTITQSIFVNSDVRFVLESPDRFPGAVLGPDDSLRFIVRFRTTGAGEARNELLIETSDTTPGGRQIFVEVVAIRSSLEVLPGDVRFGNVLACEEKRIDVLLVNGGAGVTTVELPRFAGDGDVFRIDSSIRFPIAVSPRSTLTLPVFFAPDDAGVFNDTLLIEIEECEGTVLRVPVSGRGENASLAADVVQIVFPDLPSCLNRRDTTLRIRNNGTVQMIVSSLELDAASFDAEWERSLPDTLNPGEERSVRVAFAPEATGDFNAELVIEGDPCDVELRIPLAASRRQPASVTLSRDTIDFGLVDDCAGPDVFREEAVRITNGGVDVVNLFTPVLIGPFVSACPIPGSLFTGEGVDLCIRYVPGAEGSDEGWGLIPYSVGDCADTLRIRLTGERTIPRVEVEPAVIVMPDLETCLSGMDTSIVVRNPSRAAIMIDSLVLSDHLLPIDDRFPLALGPGEDDTIRVRFAPSTSGQIAARLALFTSPCDDTLDVEIGGLKEGVVLAADADSLNFGTTFACDPAVVRDTILRITRNGQGAAPARLRLLRLKSGEQFALPDSAGVVGEEIVEGVPLEIAVRFGSSDSGTMRDTLEIVFDPCGDTLRIPLVGRVIEPNVVIFGQNLGDVTVGQPVSIDVIVANFSELPVTVDTIDLPEGLVPASPFPTLPARLDPDPVGTVTLPVTFTPSDTGEINYTIGFMLEGDCPFEMNAVITARAVRPATPATFCISGLIAEPGVVGDTADVPIGIDVGADIDDPVGLRFVAAFDPERFDFVGVEGGSVADIDEAAGTVAIVTPPATSFTSPVAVLRFRLLAGEKLSAVVKLDSVTVVSGSGLAPRLCADSANVAILNRCLLTGLSLGKYPNALERPVPNPVSDEVSVTFQQLEDAETVLSVWNLDGREMLRPLQSWLPGGRYTVRFSVAELPVGTYFYQVRAGSWSGAGRLVIQR